VDRRLRRTVTTWLVITSIALVRLSFLRLATPVSKTAASLMWIKARFV
jgi:hypothetical protein